jgi:hypothetical protein
VTEPESEEARLERAVIRTSVIRAPKQSLSTFGITTINYHLLSLPSYETADLETIVRSGRVLADRPRIVTPYYLSRLDGFSDDARHYFQKLVEERGADASGVLYTYRNEPKSTEIVPGGLEETACKINEDIDRRGEMLTAVIRGEDALWDVSVMKFIFDLTSFSVAHNVAELGSQGLLNIQDGVPAQARINIEEMFKRLRHGEIDPRELQIELERWGLFESYQDRFFSAFRRM